MKKFFVFSPCPQIFIFSAVIAVAVNSACWACSAPVFRYALENWSPDVYFVGILHKGELTGQAKDAAELLEGYSRAAGGAANIAIDYLDVIEQPTPEAMSLIESEKIDPNQPHMLVYMPAIAGNIRPVWKSLLTLEQVEKIIDSPARKEIASRLLKDDSAVWLFLESGQAEKDEPAFKLLEERLPELQNTVKLPQDPWIAGDDGSDANSPPKIELKFSVMRLNRDDPAEAFLVSSLLASESDLRDFNEPMAFPVLGRGLVLYALVGKGIAHGNILQACEFLAGACSCVVKAQNPGVDLLMNVDWPNLIVPIIADQPMPQLVNISEFLRPDSDSAPVIAQSEHTIELGDERPARGILLPVVLATLAGCLVLALGAAAIYRSKKKSG